MESLVSQGFYEEKKSKFFAYIYRVSDPAEIKKVLNRIKIEHNKAKHILYSYRISQSQVGASENKEPIRAAHSILFILEKKNLESLLVVIVRYYGGQKLGASNLEKAYISAFNSSFAPLNNTF